VAASFISTWLALAVFVVATGFVVRWLRGGTASPPAGPRPGRAAVDDTPRADGTGGDERPD